MAAAVMTGFLAEVPAGAQTSTKTQEEPNTVWGHPNTGQSMDGMGTWMYVAAAPAAKPGQVSRNGYQYLMSFAFEDLRLGYVGLATGPNGPVARIAMSDLVTGGAPIGAEVAYNWSPGRFYFVYVQHLAGNALGAWIMDWETGVWTHIGTVDPPDHWGRMLRGAKTLVSRWGAAAPADCAGYPVVDAYFFPVLGYTGSNFEIGVALPDQQVQPADCPSQTAFLANGWVHYRLGT